MKGTEYVNEHTKMQETLPTFIIAIKRNSQNQTTIKTMHSMPCVSCLNSIYKFHVADIPSH